MNDAHHPVPESLTERIARRIVRLLPRARHVAVRFLRPRLAPRGPFISTFDHGTRFIADLNEPTSSNIFFYGFYEQVFTAVFLHLLRPGQTVIDVGANLGYFTLLAARRVGQEGSVYAFEPDPPNAAALKANLALNHYPKVTVEELAIGAGAGRATLVSDSQGTRSTVSMIAGPRSGQGMDVPVSSLDGYCRAKGIATADLLKMDIEGGEADAVTGMAEGIRAGTYQRVLLELHPPKLSAIGRTPESVLIPFLEAGYTCWDLPNRIPSLFRHYSLRFDPSWLRPHDASKPVGAWPHFLLLAPGIEFGGPGGD